jgi:hypothetical protein
MKLLSPYIVLYEEKTMITHIPSAAQDAITQVCPAFSSITSSVIVAFGWKTIQPTLQVCPFKVRNKVQSGTDHSLHNPDHEAVARIFEFGLNWQ